MPSFHHILFVSHGVRDETQAIGQAIKLACANQAQLDVLITCPPFPDTLKEYRASYEESLLERMQKTIKAAKTNLHISKNKIPVHIELECGNTPAVRIIRHVLRNNYDLVVKEVETNESNKGFKALDMELLRKCPCALFLYRPFKQESHKTRIAVAIDASEQETAGQDLALRLLDISQLLAKHYEGNLTIISCWDFALENYLRNNLSAAISNADLDAVIAEEKISHARALQVLIKQSKISSTCRIEHLKGRPENLIPAFITEKKIDVLIMGTVARTGISGFFIGNTAENILQKIDCSLLALKPQGFVSPIKAY
ncbi:MULTISPECIES: universal stress protein [Legionella]|uniref:Universal stress protein n=1 Tax=Legionella septentrionalis TaxID=2498109 RepID=A0A3S0WR50_9GAMM|nr:MULTISPECIES: universal stress protein [Legionella]MCP0912956.1 universal stress protein [Legionella sp. 27cVA30]RUQ84513.1 universal stress protein [Legionella septentrionalis]RUQ96752.1 universal stress protein [Legionella septentrionalis]RUR10143.1 universal stress protein [Legionella septentrionalis]RUR15465.1 universal stress protein [Legionella septentrionalis]